MRHLICSVVATLFLISVSMAGDCVVRPRTVYPTYVQAQANYVLVPKVIEVEVHRDHYYSIDPNYQAVNLVRELRLLLAEQGRTPPAPLQQQVNPSPQVDPKREQAVDNRQMVAASYQNPQLVKIVNDSCVKCHAKGNVLGKGAKMPLLTLDDKLLDLPEGKANKTFRMVNTGEMPKSSKPIDDNSVKLFLEWAVAQEGR